jgi:hypothetical protein
MYAIRCGQGVRKALSGAHSGGRKFSDLGTSGEVVCMNSRISSIYVFHDFEEEKILSWIRRYNHQVESLMEAKWRRRK